MVPGSIPGGQILLVLCSFIVKYTELQMTPAGLEYAIPGSVGRCLIRWAAGPDAEGTKTNRQNLRC